MARTKEKLPSAAVGRGEKVWETAEPFVTLQMRSTW
jgi:hypothetical protein